MDWKVGDYGVTINPLTENYDAFLPTGTYVTVKAVGDRSYMNSEVLVAEAERFIFSGEMVLFEAISLSGRRVCFTRWATFHTDDVVKVDDEMKILAIAATGL